MPDHLSSYSVAIFAYNEEKTIGRCIESVVRNADKNLQEIVVLANGCTDNTCNIVESLSAKIEILKLVRIDEGDKCNAWNQYVYHHADENRSVHFFTDGDCTFDGNVFSVLSTRLQHDENANAAAGVPLSGRNRKKYLNLLQDRYCLFGNCYALKEEFLTKIKDLNFHLPKGLLWIDSAITKAVNSDLGHQMVGYNDRIVYEPNCGYRFDSIKPFSWKDLRVYFSRLARYKAGQLQEEHLEKMAFADWPKDLTRMNQTILADIDSGNKRLAPWFKGAIRKKLSQNASKS